MVKKKEPNKPKPAARPDSVSPLLLYDLLRIVKVTLGIISTVHCTNVDDADKLYNAMEKRMDKIRFDLAGDKEGDISWKDAKDLVVVLLEGLLYEAKEKR